MKVYMVIVIALFHRVLTQRIIRGGNGLTIRPVGFHYQIPSAHLFTVNLRLNRIIGNTDLAFLARNEYGCGHHHADHGAE